MKKIFILFLLIFYSILPTIAKEKINVTHDIAGIWVFEIDTKKYGDKIKPYMAQNLTTAQKVFEDNCFDLVVNGGFFDVKNGKSVSYVKIDNKLVSDVNDHQELIKSLENENRLDNVLNRAELRILENKHHKLKFDIAYHNDKVQKGYTIKHSLQAGPMLKPKMDLAKEGFVVYEDDMVKSQSVDILKRRERTAIGLRRNKLYIVLFTQNHKVDANEMRDYMSKELKLKKILAFDGGLSTSLTYREKSIGSFGKYQRKVKSFLIIER